jgi:hypothetical protein
MKLCCLIFIFGSLSVFAAQEPALFKFEGIIKRSIYVNQHEREVVEYLYKVNNTLEEIAAKNLPLEVEIKRFLDTFYTYLSESYSKAAIEERERHEIAYYIMAEHLVPELRSLKVDAPEFLNNFLEMFKFYMLYKKEKFKSEPSRAEDFLENLIQKNPKEFTPEDSDLYWSVGLYNIHRYLVVQYLMTLTKGQVFNIVFRDGLPESFTKKPLNLAVDDIKLILENVSKRFLREMKECLCASKGKTLTDEQLSEDENVKLFEAALAKLLKIALPEIKNINWLHAPQVKTQPTSSNPNPGDNNKDQGLFGGNGKIVATCAVVIFIALLCGGIAFWRLRLRNKNPITQSA